MSSQILRFLLSRADETLGKERAEQLRSDLEQTADDIEKLRAIPLEVDDEP
jgi:hypothetical protein